MFKFPGQRPNEKVLIIIRKHAIVYVRIIIAFVVTVAAPLIIFLAAWFSYYPFAEYRNLDIGIGLFSCIYLLFGLLLTCIAWINEQFDLFVLTNERLIDITQVTFLKRTVSSTPLNQIQDTTSDITGVLPTLLNYGNIEVQTAAGDASKFEIDRVPDPGYVAREILNRAHADRTGEQYDETEDKDKLIL
ncbi:hypothetical protein KJ742_03390 [Patescibacteria group bacterium]|nr:hypothetical protein [Patescibacteria group bacterium]MBU1682964.1 hypothetical protein [Patescibacteria group bacterium]MBU1934876.1 hypothetical protein [Patescibacteria group bacterium]